MRVALETLGCKVNQYESSAFLEGFAEAGWQVVSFSEIADFYVVHSCTVTNKAAYQTRQLLRRAWRMNPRARVAVVGCDAQIQWKRYTQERLATHIVGSEEKFRLRHWLEKPATPESPCVAVSDSRAYGPMQPLPVTAMIGDRSRAFLKIQDGCDAFCAYCIVPFSRGRSRSLEPEAVLRQLERLTRCGYQEVVFTGIHLGQWGKDLPPGTLFTSHLPVEGAPPLPAIETVLPEPSPNVRSLGQASLTPRSLPELLREIDGRVHPPRVRLSSLESREVTDDLLKTLGALSWVCPHFHIPLQSGDPQILAAMGRPYDPEQYADTLYALHRLFPHAALGADVIVGFPGETEAQFARTVELIQSLPITYLHVFPYSPRPGTRAAAMGERIVGDVLKTRAHILRDLGRRKKRLFLERFVSAVLEVLVEARPVPHLWHGTSENYLSVRFTAKRPPEIGSLVRVRVDRATDQGLLGTAVV